MSHRRKMGDIKRLKKAQVGYASWYDESRGFWRRIYAPRRGKYLRKLSNRKVRRTRYIPNGSLYKRNFDYWWELD